MIALLLVVLAASPQHKGHDHNRDHGHAKAHAVQAVPTWGVGAFVSRDLEDGPTLIGGEIMGRSKSLGVRASIAGGDRVTRTTADALFFFCPKPVQPYVGLGMVFDCVTPRPTQRHVDPPAAPRDPPSLIFGIQGRTQNALFGEGRWTFGDRSEGQDENPVTIEAGIRHRF